MGAKVLVKFRRASRSPYTCFCVCVARRENRDSPPKVWRSLRRQEEFPSDIQAWIALREPTSRSSVPFLDSSLKLICVIMCLQLEGQLRSFSIAFSPLYKKEKIINSHPSQNLYGALGQVEKPPWHQRTTENINEDNINLWNFVSFFVLYIFLLRAKHGIRNNVLQPIGGDFEFWRIVRIYQVW